MLHGNAHLVPMHKLAWLVYPCLKSVSRNTVESLILVLLKCILQLISFDVYLGNGVPVCGLPPF